MKSNHKVRSLRNKMPLLRDGDRFWLAVNLTERKDNAVALGFSWPLIAGEQLLPSAEFGPAARRNAEGEVVVHRDQPKEKATRQIEWHWKEFRGRYDTVDRSRITDVSYERYPRTHLPPHAIEIRVHLGDQALAVAGPFVMAANDDCATNSHNMFIEVFGECEFLREDMSRLMRAPIKRLNWQLLPPGKNPWTSAKPSLERVVNAADKGNQPVIRARFEEIGRHNPEFIALGNLGFDGYVVFGFPKQKMCLLESRHFNNATYVLNLDSWEAVSQLTKAEILGANAHLARIIHIEGWVDRLANVFQKKRKAA